tara:strand:- start:177 stop:299 length:123 start_codon:yes stop_codon:yes gene_type:complete
VLLNEVLKNKSNQKILEISKLLKNVGQEIINIIDEIKARK